jgi:hypothetical protein
MGVDYVEDTAPLFTLEETKILDGNGKIHDVGDVVGLCVRFMRSQTTYNITCLPYSIPEK